MIEYLEVNRALATERRVQPIDPLRAGGEVKSSL